MRQSIDYRPSTCHFPSSNGHSVNGIFFLFRSIRMHGPHLLAGTRGLLAHICTRCRWIGARNNASAFAAQLIGRERAARQAIDGRRVVTYRLTATAQLKSLKPWVCSAVSKLELPTRKPLRSSNGFSELDQEHKIKIEIKFRIKSRIKQLELTFRIALEGNSTWLNRISNLKI